MPTRAPGPARAGGESLRQRQILEQKFQFGLLITVRLGGFDADRDSHSACRNP